MVNLRSSKISFPSGKCLRPNWCQKSSQFFLTSNRSSRIRFSSAATEDVKIDAVSMTSCESSCVEEQTLLLDRLCVMDFVRASTGASITSFSGSFATWQG